MSKYTYERALQLLKEIEAQEDRYRERQQWAHLSSLSITPFLIRMTKKVTIRCGGEVSEVLLPGDVLVATARNDLGSHYVSSPVSVYYHEAEAIAIERPVEDHVAVVGYN